MNTGPSLKSRVYGRGLTQMVASVVPDFKSCIEEETEHKQVKVRHGWLADCDMHELRVHCRGCDKLFRHSSSAAALFGLDRLLTQDALQEWVVEDLAPFFASIAEEPCFGAAHAALLAEFLTYRLVDAGRQGVPYAQLVHEAVHKHDAPPADVDRLIRKMEFVEHWVPLASRVILPKRWEGEWTLPILTLPADHPLRDW